MKTLNNLRLKFSNAIINLIFLLTLIFLPGCDFIGGVFQTGLGIGALIVIIIVILVVVISRRGRR